MAFVSPQLVDAIAHSVDISKLAPEAAKALAQDVEYKLRELIQDAQKFARHSRRLRLTTDDVNSALRMRNAEPMYGFSSKDPAKYIKAVGHADVYCLEDPDIPVQQLVEKRLPKAPVEVGVMPHWLFIRGVQPVTPETTPLEQPPTKRARAPRFAPSTAAAVAATGGRPAAPSGSGAPAALGGEDASSVQVQLPVQHVLPLELQLYFQKSMEVVSQSLDAACGATLPGTAAAAGQGEAPAPGEGAERGARAAPGPQGVQATHWGELAAPATPGGSRTAPRATVHAQDALLAPVLASLATDPGLRPLAPYLVKFLADQVAARARNAPALRLLLRLVRTLLANEALGLVAHVHQLLPALLTCLLAHGVGSARQEGHWDVRVDAAQAVAEVCVRFGAAHPNAQPRVQKTLLKALLDTGKPLSTHFGAIVGLGALGPEAVRSMLIPQLPLYLSRLQPILETAAPTASGPADDNGMEVDGGGGQQGLGKESDAPSRLDAGQVHGALVDVVGSALYELMKRSAMETLLGGRPTEALLGRVAVLYQQETAEQQAAGALADDRAKAAALLTLSWREDIPLPDVAWAAGELLGPSLTARLPQARAAQVSL